LGWTLSRARVTAKQRIRDLDICMQAFAECILSLSETLFLTKLDEQWSARDVTAHLIGWNRYTLEGSEQIRRGEQPSYFIDPGDDFSKANAASVTRYSSTSARELVAELQTSARELSQYLMSLKSTEWHVDHGVRYQGGRVTIANTLEALIGDYILHREQIERWVRARGA
jgi:hypothetical protein